MKYGILVIAATLLIGVCHLGSPTRAEAQTTFIHTGVPAPGTTLGWNFGYIRDCYVVFDSGQNWFFALIQGGGYGATNNPGIATMVAPACQTGNLIAVHVTSLRPFTWDAVYVYPHR